MKRTLLALTVLAFILFFITPRPIFSQEKVLETDTPIGIDPVSTDSASTAALRVNYELPYPGMLPDHPLYILKVIRDGVVKLLINDPVKLARFSLLASEKRMYASKMLAEKGNDHLAVITIAKSNNYIDDAFKAIDTVAKQNPKNADINPFLFQLRAALLKHKEVSRDIRPLLDESVLDGFTVEQKKIDGYLQRIGGRLKK